MFNQYKKIPINELPQKINWCKKATAKHTGLPQFRINIQNKYFVPIMEKYIKNQKEPQKEQKQKNA